MRPPVLECQRADLGPGPALAERSERPPEGVGPGPLRAGPGEGGGAWPKLPRTRFQPLKACTVKRVQECVASCHEFADSSFGVPGSTLQDLPGTPCIRPCEDTYLSRRPAQSLVPGAAGACSRQTL